MKSSMPPFVGTEDVLTERIIGVFYEVYNELGFGFLESVYARSMGLALGQAGLDVASEVAIPVSFGGSWWDHFGPTWLWSDALCWS